MELNFKSFGHGPALVILHGLFGSLDNWVTHAKAFGEDFSVFILDQRNHGKSPHSEEWDYHIMADDLLNFLDRESIFHAHILGHSMGGKTAMQFAGEHAERVDKLVVVDMSPRRYEPQHTVILDALWDIELEGGITREEIEAQIYPEIPEFAVRQFLLKGLSRNGKEGYRWKFNLEVIRKKYHEVLKETEMDHPYLKDALFISGGNSDYVDESDRGIILEKFPKARFEVVEGAGHWLHSEAPNRFRQAVRSFLLE